MRIEKEEETLGLLLFLPWCIDLASSHRGRFLDRQAKEGTQVDT